MAHGLMFLPEDAEPDGCIDILRFDQGPDDYYYNVYLNGIPKHERCSFEDLQRLGLDEYPVRRADAC